jgi:hypothetical protein
MSHLELGECIHEMEKQFFKTATLKHKKEILSFCKARDRLNELLAVISALMQHRMIREETL